MNSLDYKLVETLGLHLGIAIAKSPGMAGASSELYLCLSPYFSSTPAFCPADGGIYDGTMLMLILS